MADVYYVSGEKPPCVMDWKQVMSWVMIRTWHTVPKEPAGKEMHNIFRENMNRSWGEFKSQCGFTPPLPPKAGTFPAGVA